MRSGTEIGKAQQMWGGLPFGAHVLTRPRLVPNDRANAAARFELKAATAQGRLGNMTQMREAAE